MTVLLALKLRDEKGSFSTDVFALRQSDCALIYAPLLGVIARTNFTGVALLRRLDRMPGTILQPSETAFLDQLARLGLAPAAGGIKLSRCDQNPFSPRCVSLYLTDACNMRCIYCYARAGDSPTPTVLNFDAGAAGIRFVAEAVKRAGQDGFAVSFHGAGEPTLAWDLLVRLADYARQLGRRENLRVSLVTCTNGVMSADQARWLAQHTDGATVSLDGPAPIQDVLRPLQDGGGSFDQVARTLAIYRSEGFCHSIRATITSANVRQMAGMVDLMVDRFAASHLQFDPVLVTGRCLETGCGAVDFDTFALEFMRAFDRALERQVELGCCILSLDALRTYYCCAAADGFTITQDGLVTACFDVYRPSHPFAGHFIYGSYDSQSGTFRLDRHKLSRLRDRNACRLASCQNCFCKYMCGGDCIVNAMRQGFDLLAGGGRCRLMQAIGAYLLARKAADHEQRVHHKIIDDQGNDFSLANATWAEGHGDQPILISGTRISVKESYYMRPPPMGDAVRQHIFAGNTAYRWHDYQTALRHYEQARQLDSRSADARNNMALVLHKLGRLQEALDEAEAAVALANDNPALHMTLGKVLAACGRLSEALAAFDRVLALEPNRTDARYNRAWVLTELGRAEEAETVLAELIETTGNGSDADVLLQSLRLRRGAGEDSSRCLSPGAHAWILALNVRLLAGDGVPDLPGDRTKLATVLDDCSREQYGRARQSLDELILTCPSSATLRALSGMLWQTQGNPGRANAEMCLAQGVLAGV